MFKNNLTYQFRHAQQYAIVELYKRLSKQPQLNTNDFLHNNEEIINEYIYYQLSLQEAILSGYQQNLELNFKLMGRLIEPPSKLPSNLPFSLPNIL